MLYLHYFVKSLLFPQYPINKNLGSGMRYIKVYTKLPTKNINQSMKWRELNVKSTKNQ